MITIRQVLPTESSQLQTLCNEVFVDNSKYDTDLVENWAYSEVGKAYFEALVHDPKSLCLVAENETGELVGYLAGSPKEFSYRKSKYLELDNMGVMPAYRSQGIGENLVKECLTWAKHQGFDKVFVSAYSQNEKAIRFYTKCGFEMIDLSLEMKLG